MATYDHLIERADYWLNYDGDDPDSRWVDEDADVLMREMLEALKDYAQYMP